MVDPEVLITYLGFFFFLICWSEVIYFVVCLFRTTGMTKRMEAVPAKGSSKYILAGKLDNRIPISVENGILGNHRNRDSW